MYIVFYCLLIAGMEILCYDPNMQMRIEILSG